MMLPDWDDAFDDECGFSSDTTSMASRANRRELYKRLDARKSSSVIREGAQVHSNRNAMGLEDGNIHTEEAFADTCNRQSFSEIRQASVGDSISTNLKNLRKHWETVAETNEQRSAPSCNVQQRQNPFRSSAEISDMFVAREFMLHLSDSARASVNVLRRLEDYVDRSGDFDIQRVSNVMTIASLLGTLDPIETSDSSRLPKEAYTLAGASKDLATALRSMCLAVADSYGARKMAYSNQIRKLKDASNLAIRNALQNERAESTFQLTKLRDVYRSDKVAIEERLNRQLADSEHKCAKLEEEIFALQQSVTQLRAQTENIAELRALAVDRATSELGAEFEKIKSELNDQADRRVRVVEAKAAEKAEAMLEESRRQMSSMHKGEEGVIHLLKLDKTKLESELIDLRQQLMKALAQVSNEKEKCAVMVQDERSRFEKSLQELAAQNLASRAQLQEDFAARMRESKGAAEERLENAMNNAEASRKQLMVAHAFELKTLADRHSSEMSRVQAQSEERRKWDLAKLRTAQNHKLNRATRENEKLQRLMSKLTRDGAAGTLSLSHVGNGSSRGPSSDASYFDRDDDDDDDGGVINREGTVSGETKAGKQAEYMHVNEERPPPRVSQQGGRGCVGGPGGRVGGPGGRVGGPGGRVGGPGPDSRAKESGDMDMDMHMDMDMDYIVPAGPPKPPPPRPATPQPTHILSHQQQADNTTWNPGTESGRSSTPSSRSSDPSSDGLTDEQFGESILDNLSSR
jgi:hypothetical protein